MVMSPDSDLLRMSYYLLANFANFGEIMILGLIGYSDSAKLISLALGSSVQNL